MIKIAMTGAGSIGFTRKLVRDVLGVPELADTHFALHDVSQHNLQMVEQLVRRDIEHNRLPARVTASTDRREAFKDASYVLCTIRQGGLEAFELDISIPLKYGIDQCVGDTLCAGGIMYAQRTVHELLAICNDIKAVAKPGALFLNYANPMAMNTWACNAYGGVKTVGLCHGVQGAHWQVVQCTQMWARQQGLLAEEKALTKHDVQTVFAGINHQTWCVQATWRDEAGGTHDMIPLLPDLFASHPTFQRTEKVRVDVLKRFGFYSTESNGHLSEYVPWYRKRLATEAGPAEAERWLDLSSWINGETGGYLRVCTEGRNWFESDFPKWLAEEPPAIGQDKRSEEHGSWIIEGLETGRVYRGHFNVMNRGHIRNLPDGCCIEIPGYVDRTGIQLPVVGELPPACAATCSASVRVQQMAMEAAIRGDAMLLKQAMLHDPLTAAVCDPEEIWQMTDEMLVAQAQWLPQFMASGAVAAAEKNLAAHAAAGTRVRLREGFQGAARIETRSEEQLRASSDASVLDADKAQKARAAATA